MHPSQMEKSSRTGCESHPVLHLQCIVWVLAHGKPLGNSSPVNSRKRKYMKRKKKWEKGRRILGEREGRGQSDRVLVWSREIRGRV